MPQSYYEELTKKNTLLLRKKLMELPTFLKEFFRGVEDRTTARTRIGYAHDFSVFFNFLTAETVKFAGKNVTCFELSDLDMLTPDDIEEYMEYLSYYIKTNSSGETEIQNKERGKSRKLYSIRSLYAYFYKKGKIKTNPTELVDSPKLHEKAKIYLDVDEVAKLLDEVESGEHLTDKQKEYHKYTKKRDLAILTLLLGTGIRVTECVGLNIDHISCENGCFLATRKGGNEVVLYFGGEVEKALNDYLDERELITPAAGHEDALFLSIQNRRITDRAVQILVKKYSKLVTNMKRITPHKLRSTFGTNLYKETGDIYLVADVLGHKDVNTTRKNYADTHGDQGRRAVKNMTLRE